MSKSHLQSFTFPKHFKRSNKKNQVAGDAKSPPPPINETLAVKPQMQSSDERKSPLPTKIRIKLPNSTLTKNPAKMPKKSAEASKEGDGAKSKSVVAVQLTDDEIKEDLYSITGRRAARKIKKRERNVQKKIDQLCPGQLLSTISTNSYKVSSPSV